MTRVAEYAVTFTVFGDPGPQGSKTLGHSKKTGKPYVRESSSRVKPWRKAVTAAAVATGVAVPTGAAVSVEILFLIERPTSHLGTGRNAGKVRKSAPVFPISRSVGDVDKLERSTFDGLTAAGIITDDSHIIESRPRKWYAQPGEPGRAIITVRSLEGPLIRRAANAA